MSFVSKGNLKSKFIKVLLEKVQIKNIFYSNKLLLKITILTKTIVIVHSCYSKMIW